MKHIFILIGLLVPISSLAAITESEHQVKIIKRQIDVMALTQKCLKDLEQKTWGYICTVSSGEVAFDLPFEPLYKTSQRIYKEEIKTPFRSVTFQFSGLLKRGLNPNSDTYISNFSVVVDNDPQVKDQPSQADATRAIQGVLSRVTPVLYLYYQVIE
ncbi:MAG: hypothetical protein KDD61_11295 [Bdellovibrionales bacterium]|nr:hypothetical protein [Bdellovibrionales bacterium]